MFKQYDQLQTCDKLEIQRLLWGTGVRPEQFNRPGVITTPTLAHTQQQQPQTQQQPQQQQQQFFQLVGTLPATTLPTTSRNHHQSHQRQGQISPQSHHHLLPQYNIVQAPAPAHSSASASLSGFTPGQRLSFIPKHLATPQQPEMMPYNLGNKPQQHNLVIPPPTANSFIRTPQRSDKGHRGRQEPMPSMPNLFAPSPIYSSDTLVNYSGGMFQQYQQPEQERDETPEREEVVQSEEYDNDEDPPANGDSDSGDEDYESEQEEEDDDIVEEVSGPYHCGFCHKVYKRKKNYLSHLKDAHNRKSSIPPTPQERRSSQSHRHREEPPAPQPPDEESAEYINSCVNGDSYHCKKCSKKFKTERNFRKHLELHREGTSAQNSPAQQQQRGRPRSNGRVELDRNVGQLELQRAISGILDGQGQHGAPSSAFGTPYYGNPVQNQQPAPVLQLFKCPYCPQFLDDNDKLRQHQISDHMGQIYVCADCNDLIPASSFSEHRKKHLSEPTKWKCKICPDKTFDVYKEFKQHFESHLAEPYKEPSQEFLTRKVPTMMEVKAAENLKIEKVEGNVKIKDALPSLSQTDLKKAVELFTGSKDDDDDDDEPKLIQVVLNPRPRIKPSATMVPVRARPSPATARAKPQPAKKPVVSPTKRKSGKISSDSNTDSDPDFDPRSENIGTPSSSAKKRRKRSRRLSASPDSTPGSTRTGHGEIETVTLDDDDEAGSTAIAEPIPSTSRQAYGTAITSKSTGEEEVKKPVSLFKLYEADFSGTSTVAENNEDDLTVIQVVSNPKPRIKPIILSAPRSLKNITPSKPPARKRVPPLKIRTESILGLGSELSTDGLSSYSEPIAGPSKSKKKPPKAKGGPKKSRKSSTKAKTIKVPFAGLTVGALSPSTSFTSGFGGDNSPFEIETVMLEDDGAQTYDDDYVTSSPFNKHDCLICKAFFPDNAEMRAHILEAHCREVDVSVLPLEKDLALLDYIEILNSDEEEEQKNEENLGNEEEQKHTETMEMENNDV